MGGVWPLGLRHLFDHRAVCSRRFLPRPYTSPVHGEFARWSWRLGCQFLREAATVLSRTSSIIDLDSETDLARLSPATGKVTGSCADGVRVLKSLPLPSAKTWSIAATVASRTGRPIVAAVRCSA